MRNLFWVLALACLPTVAVAADKPDWAYAAQPQGLQRPDPSTVVKVPGSDKTYTVGQINDPFGPPDWFPNEHAPMPAVVAQGTKPNGRACAQCHLVTGDGHPESANVAGLPAAYIERQMADFASGARKSARIMEIIAKAVSADDVKAAGAYFAERKPAAGYTKVVEAAEVPKTYIGEGAMRFVTAGTDKEPIGERIIEVPVEEELVKARDVHAGFVAYVPPGSIAKGEALVTTGGGGKTVACAICHGEGLKGLGEVPSLAGRSPMYLTRQLLDFKSGARAGTWGVLMQQVVAKLDVNDVIALSAYMASRQP